MRTNRVRINGHEYLRTIEDIFSNINKVTGQKKICNLD